MDALSQDYIALAFAIDRHFPGFVDAYFGPPELRDHAQQGAPTEPAALLERASRLAEEVAASSYPQRRQDYMGAQVRAMVTVCRRLCGEALSYAEEVRGCFDIEASHTPEELFDEAITNLDALLPGEGSIAERLLAWRQRTVVTPEQARNLIACIAEESRRRIRALLQIDLPAGEQVVFDLVSDKPWSGYNWYLGDYRSRVEVNTDLPIYASGLTSLICHEAYPGHHTEHAIKEQLFYHERGYGEQAIQLLAAPECVISEGIAMLADAAIFPGDDLFRWQADVLYPLAGIVADPEREACIVAASRVLRAVNANAALLLHVDGATEDEVVAYLQRYGLRNNAEARHTLRFIADPLYRAYVFTYHTGRALLGRWLELGDPAARFRTLLSEQISPSLVESWLIDQH